MDKKTIKDICVINPSKKLPILPETEISFLPMEAVSTDGLINLSGKIQFNKTQSYSVFQNGDVLFAKITPCMENGKGAVVHSLLNNYGAGSTEFIVLRPLPETIISKYLYYFMQQKTFRLNCQQNMTGSAGQKRVPIKYLERYTIPVPPLPEQERIVAKIEELFSQLDAAVAELKSVKEKLAIYRQAVLKEAFEGKLTEKWRILHHKNNEWCVFNIKNIVQKGQNSLKAGPFGSALKKSCYVPSGYKVYGQEQVIAGNENIGDYYISEEKYQELISCKIQPYDILISLVGTVGKVLILSAECEPGVINPRLIKVSLDRKKCSQNFSNTILQAIILNLYINRKFMGRQWTY